MQQFAISPRHTQIKMTRNTNQALISRSISNQDESTEDFSISVLEWLNAELRKEAEKKEIVALHSNVNLVDRLQNMLSSKATGITIMVVSLFLV